MTDSIRSVEDQLVDRLVSLVSDDPELHAWAEKRALQTSGTKRWTQEQWERSGPAQSTYQYTLYYNEMTRLKSMIATRALVQLIGV